MRLRIARWGGWLALAVSACGGAESGDAGGQGDGAAGADATVHDAGPADAAAADAPGERDAEALDGDYGLTADGSCYFLPAPNGNPAWQTGSCPDGGCPGGFTCVHSTGEHDYDYGCALIAPACADAPSCACMGCICGMGCGESSGEITCSNGTISRRAFKDDVVYVDDEERQALARQALDIPLARYRYKSESQDARRRLGFIIDDQPDPSPAVLADRTHVDDYGYASMILATVQQQAKELELLRERIDALEKPLAPRTALADRTEAPDSRCFNVPAGRRAGPERDSSRRAPDGP